MVLIQANGEEISNDKYYDIETKTGSGDSLKSSSTLLIRTEGALHLNGTEFTCTGERLYVGQTELEWLEIANGQTA